MLSEINQTENDKYSMIAPICRILKAKIVKFIETESRKVFAGGCNGRTGREVGDQTGSKVWR